MKSELQKSKCLWIGIGIIYFPILCLSLWVGPLFAFGIWSLFALPVIGALAAYASKQSKREARPLRLLSGSWLGAFLLVFFIYWRAVAQDEWLANQYVTVVLGIGYLVAPLFFWGLGYQELCRCIFLKTSPTNSTP